MDAGEDEMTKVSFEQMRGGQAAEGFLIIADMRKSEVEAVPEQFDGGHGGAAQGIREGRILDEGEHSITVPAAQPVRAVATRGARIEIQRPAPVRLDLPAMPRNTPRP